MSSANEQMVVKFWGVRGSIPTPTSPNMGIGGNTSCLEVRLPSGQVIIVDGGTGVRALGSALALEAAGSPSDLHLFLTHFHWDHIQGLPFFQPLYSAENSVTFYSMDAPEQTREILEGQMNVPYFPVDFRFLPAKRSFICVAGKTFNFGETEVNSFPLNHPQGCHGYSFTHSGRKLVFASDLEHGDPDFDRTLLAAAQDADILIFDAQFTPEEYTKRRGWGHSTWLQATEVARQTRAKKLILFHHDPMHTDSYMESILLDARRQFPETYLAIEGESHGV
jgi:phosphoribosyl 1,2-cyclic phosphodiesterase